MSGPAFSLRLGLIGAHVAASRSPRLHRAAARLCGGEARYDLLMPAEMGQDFAGVFAAVAQSHDGVNITYPFKEEAARLVTIEDPLVRAIGAVNTVCFRPDGAFGYNTDHSGFIAAWTAARGNAAPGVACLVGTGGVGRALAFALIALGATELRLVDRDPARAEALARDLAPHAGACRIVTFADAAAAATGADGVLNGTPIGMEGHPGSPVPTAALEGIGWAFDAVYTPPRTEFLADAEAAGAVIIGGAALLFHQGLDAWAHFSGRPLDPAALAGAIAADEAAARQ